jgi:hypothetical protein
MSMVAVTYGDARVSARKAAKAGRVAKTAPRKNWWARALNALMESRMQQARREVARHMHLLPYSLDERGNRIVRIGSKDMPFGGW